MELHRLISEAEALCRECVFLMYSRSRVDVLAAQMSSPAACDLSSSSESEEAGGETGEDMSPELLQTVKQNRETGDRRASMADTLSSIFWVSFAYMVAMC